MRALAIPALALGSLLMAAPVLAQEGTAGPATTGSVGSAPQRIGTLAPTGKTKPPGAALGNDLGTRPDLLERSRQIDDRINTGICSGCR